MYYQSIILTICMLMHFDMRSSLSLHYTLYTVCVCVWEGVQEEGQRGMDDLPLVQLGCMEGGRGGVEVIAPRVA